MIASFYAGQQLQFTFTFTNLSGSPTDPTGVTVSYRNEAYATLTTVNLAGLTKTSTGVYTLNVNTTGMSAGTWTMQAVATGAVTAVAVITFNIEQLPIAA